MIIIQCQVKQESTQKNCFLLTLLTHTYINIHIQTPKYFIYKLGENTH